LPYQTELIHQVWVNRIPKTPNTHAFCRKITLKSARNYQI